MHSPCSPWVSCLDPPYLARPTLPAFRGQLNPVLEKLKTRFQRQPYDHVLREEERESTPLEEVAEYIARNPERRGLVPLDGFARYSYTGGLIPGYPELMPFEEGYWDRFWRVYSHLAANGLHVGTPEEPKD